MMIIFWLSQEKKCIIFAKIDRASCQPKLLALARFLHKNRPVLSFLPHFMSYVVASAIKDLLKKHGMMTSGDLPEAASAFLEEALKKAAGRAKDNGRVTVRPCDL